MAIPGPQGFGRTSCAAPAAKLRRGSAVDRAQYRDATAGEITRRRIEVAQPDREHRHHTSFEIEYLNIVIVYR